MIAALKAAWRAWRIARLNTDRDWHESRAGDALYEAQRTAIQAYHVDMMQFPLRWARLHNHVLGCEHSRRLHEQRVKQIEAQLKELS